MNDRNQFSKFRQLNPFNQFNPYSPFNQFSKIGSYNKKLNRENQEYLYSKESDDFLIMMLCSGAKDCEMGIEGAKIYCEAVMDIVEKERETFFHYPEGKMAHLLMEQILYYLEIKKEKEIDIKEYKSTFSMAFMEKGSGRTVLVNLGDNAIISVAKNRILCLQKPQKLRGQSCFVTTKGAQKAMSVEVRNLSFGENVILCSEGFLKRMNQRSTAVTLCSFDLERLNKQLQLSDNADDCSYIALVRERA